MSNDLSALPPKAKKVEKVTVMHGERLVDPYAWLTKKTDAEVLSHLEAENAYADAVMAGTEPLQKQLYDEMLGRIKQTDLSVPYPYNGYLYYSRTQEGKQYPIHCRKKGSDGAEEVILDVNELAQGQKFMSVADMEVSPDGNLLAYTSDATGFRQYKLNIKDLRTGKLLPDTAERVTSLQWASDNKTFFYSTEDNVSKRSDTVYRHVLGGKSEKLFEEKDELYRLYIGVTNDRKYIYWDVACSENNEIWFVSADKPALKPKMIEKRQGELEYYLEHHDGTFFLRTNKDAKDFRVMKTAVDKSGMKNWQPVVEQISNGVIEGITMFKTHMLMSSRVEGLPRLSVYDFASMKEKPIGEGEALYVIGESTNKEYDIDRVRFNYSSPLTPQTVREYNLKTGAIETLKVTEVLGGYDPSKYEMKRVWATALDGVKVPMGIVYRKDTKKETGNPVLLGSYGSYGIPTSFGFNSNAISLMDRGMIIATAQIRGGSDMGIKWHDDGKMMNKRNTFTDFIACADHLVWEGYTSRDRLAISGGSAGGLLIGAVLNMRPDLCKTAMLYVPFVDVINTMLDESLPLTVGEFLEWGNPKKESEYRYMRTYSPYENIRSVAYPNLLVRTSLNDSQVMYWEPAKYVARMREIARPESMVFKCNMAGGHGGSSGRYDKLKENAFDFAYLLRTLGVEK